MLRVVSSTEPHEIKNGARYRPAKHGGVSHNILIAIITTMLPEQPSRGLLSCDWSYLTIPAARLRVFRRLPG